MGNLDSLRDWGHAKDYVRMQWMMLQQNEAKDFVIATGVQHSVRDFINWAASNLGLTLRFEGDGVEECAVEEKIEGENAPNVSVNDVIVKVDKKYFRPTEVESLIGDATLAKDELGWQPEITAEEMCSEMVLEDLKIAKRNAFLKKHGHEVNISSEE